MLALVTHIVLYCMYPIVCTVGFSWSNTISDVSEIRVRKKGKIYNCFYLFFEMTVSFMSHKYIIYK